MLSARWRLYSTMSAMLFVTLVAYLAFARWDGNIISIVSGLLLSWFIPGFALMMVLYPDKLVRINTLVMSFIMSFIFDVLVGAILELLNLKLNGSGFVIGLWLIAILLLLTSGFMKMRSSSFPDPVSLKTIYKSLLDKIKNLISDPRSVKSNYLVFLILVSVLLITVSWAFKVNLSAANNVKPKPFTALAIEPSDVDVTNKYFKITIDNQEGKSMVYRLVVRKNSIIFMQRENIMVDQDEQWALEIPSSQLDGQIDLWLFRGEENESYRQVHLVVH